MPDEKRLEQLVESEIARLANESQPIKQLRSAHYLTIRVGIRTVRVLAGAALAVLSLWCISIVVEIFRIPIASLTITNVLVGVAAVVGTLIGISLAFAVAFGPPPQRPELREIAECTAREQLELEEEEAKVAHLYRRGRILGILRDPTLEKRRPWVYVVAVAACYLLIALIALVVSQCAS